MINEDFRKEVEKAYSNVLSGLSDPRPSQNGYESFLAGIEFGLTKAAQVVEQRDTKRADELFIKLRAARGKLIAVYALVEQAEREGQLGADLLQKFREIFNS